MPKPICVPCRRFFRPKKTGQYFTEGMPRGGRSGEGPAPIGNRDPSQWQPYKIWSGDVWACPDCGAEIIVGTGQQPIRTQHEPDFDRWHAHAKDIQINDC